MAAQLEVSGLLLPAERRVLVNADEPLPRRRFTLAHEVGHWVCQVMVGHEAPVYCRAEDVGDPPGCVTETACSPLALCCTSYSTA